MLDSGKRCLFCDTKACEMRSSDSNRQAAQYGILRAQIQKCGEL